MALQKPASLKDIQIHVPDITGHRLLEEAKINRIVGPQVDKAREIQKRYPFIPGEDLINEADRELNLIK